MSNLLKINKVHEILKNYNGKNPYLINLKNEVYVFKKTTLNNFHIEYILNNFDKEPILLNKVVKVANWYGEKKQIDWNTDFLIEKLLIGYVLGETDEFYHAYVKYRKSQDKMMQLFIPKKALLNPLFLEDFEQMDVDFDKYNKMANIVLKPHQEKGIKFLLTRKKCILAHLMGGGKTINSIVAALEGNFSKILVICPASIKENWKREIERFIPSDEITIVEGSKWKENKFTIINYDILDNFYEIPTEIVKRKKKNIDDNGKITYTYVEKEVVSKKSSIIDEAMANSQLFQSNFDLIIIDEAHRLSNANSGRYKIISDLIKRSNPNSIYLLTGTMITNNPMNLYNILKIIDADITKDWQAYVKRYCDGKQIYVKGERDKYTKVFLNKVKKHSWYDLTYEEKDELNQYLDKNCKKIWLTNGSSNLDELKEKIKHLYLRDLNEEIYNNFSKETIIKEYEFTSSEKEEYNKIWDDYVSKQQEKDNDINKLLDNKKLIESSVLRQATSQMMIPRTIELAESIIKNNEKVIIFCAFDNEIYSLQEYFGDKCTIHNGKLTLKEKEKSLKRFNEDDDCKILLGNLTSTSVGLNLIVANNIIFNSISWLPAENEQAEYRILRIGQNKDCHIYYQVFLNSYLTHMLNALNIKNEIINTVIVDEKNK